MEMNHQYHTPEELREIMGRLTGEKIDHTFRLFPPLYTDFGKNISIGKDVFINSGCHFQDQGDALDPWENRKNYYAPIRAGNHAWIGSNATVLPGVTIGDWSVVAAGVVVNRDVPPMTVVGGTRKVVELQGLAGGDFQPFNMVFFAAVYDKPKAVLCESSACHAQPQHVLLTAPLRIAAKASGKALILGRGELAVMKLDVFLHDQPPFVPSER